MKTNKEIITEIIEDLENTVKLNWPKAWNAKVNKEKLIECWTNPSLVDWKYLKYSNHTALSRVFKSVFANLEKKSRRSWKHYILEIYRYKYCPKCEYIKDIDKFSLDSSNIDNRDSKCKSCHNDRMKIYNKEYYQKNKESIKNNVKIYYNEHYEKNKPYYKAKEAKRRAAKINRTPIWANLDKIKEIYLNCPKDNHVDHIIPCRAH